MSRNRIVPVVGEALFDQGSRSSMRPHEELAVDGAAASSDATLPNALPGTALSELESDATTADSTTLSPKNGMRRFLVRRFWRTAAGFWGRGGSSAAWTLSAAILALILFNLGMLYAINLWNRKIFDGLQNHDSSAVWFLSLIYFPILAASVASTVIQVYVRMTLQRRWRAWLNDRLIGRWLANGRYYLLNLVSGDHKNPESRIAEDLRIATESPVEFITGVTTASISAATFVVVLWTIGGTLDFFIGGFHVVVPGFLVVAAVLYSLFATGSLVAVGSRFVPASEAKNQAEAE